MKNLKSTTILSTKLNTPLLQSGFVSRPRLVDILNNGLARKLTLVVAPTGYGKTTVISEWIHQSGLPVAWLSLDEGDSDLTRFLTYLIAALQTIDEEIGSATIDEMHASPSYHLESILSQLINELASISRMIVVIIDDYQVVDSQAIHDVVCFLIEHMPAHVHFVIASRIDPPLPTARWRGRGQLVELREADLQFTVDETAKYLTQTMGLEVGKVDLEALAARTEGWIAGLQLAAISIKGRTDISAFVTTFSGRNEFIVDYLTDEVFKKIPKAIREFLLQTSILNQLTASLCEEVTGQKNGQSTLEKLLEDHLFLIPLDSERRWFRYHALFVDMLRKRLNEEQVDLLSVLHQRAAHWLDRHGHSEQAIHHALEAKDYEQALSIVERIAEEKIVRTEFTSFLKWMDALPKQMTQARPRLLVFYALALLFSGEDVENVKTILKGAVIADGHNEISGEESALQAFIANLQGDVEKSIERSHHAMKLLSQENIYLRSLLMNNLSMAYISAGEVDLASEMFAAASRVGEQAGNYMSLIMALRRLAEVAFISGDLHQVMEICQRGIALAVSSSGKPLPVAGLLMVLQGDLLREWNDLRAADQHIRDGIELVLKWSEYMTITNYLSLARVKQALGEAREAQSAVDTARLISERTESSRMALLLVSFFQVRLWLQQGKKLEAERWEKEYRPLVTFLEAHDFNPIFHHHMLESEGIVFARIQLSQGDWYKALGILDPLLQAARNLNRKGRVIELLILRAISFFRGGELERASSSLEEALILAEPQGYIRTFIDEGETMRDMLLLLLEESGDREMNTSASIPTKYVNNLMAALIADTAGDQLTQELTTDGLIEPLSNRELEVLRFLATQLTSTEIAGELYISPNTARFHIKNIYAKLGIHRREDAVEQARFLGLL